MSHSCSLKEICSIIEIRWSQDYERKYHLMIKALALNSGDIHLVSDSATDFLRSLRLITKAEIHFCLT